MKLMSFDYTDAKGKGSHREFIELSKPTHLHFGIDVSELAEEDRINLASEIVAARNKYDMAVAELMTSFDVKHNFRQFKPEAMTNVESENFYD